METLLAMPMPTEMTVFEATMKDSTRQEPRRFRLVVRPQHRADFIHLAQILLLRGATCLRRHPIIASGQVGRRFLRRLITSTI